MACLLCDDPARRLVAEAEQLLGAAAGAPAFSTVLLVCAGGKEVGGLDGIENLDGIDASILGRIHVKYIASRNELLPFLKNFQLLPRYHQHRAILVCDPGLALLAGGGGGGKVRGALLMESLALLCNAADTATRGARADHGAAHPACKVTVALAAADHGRSVVEGGAGDAGDAAGLLAVLSHWLPVRVVT